MSQAEGLAKAATEAATPLKAMVTHSWVVLLVIAAMIIIVFLVLYIVNRVKMTKLQAVPLQQGGLIQMDNRQTVPFVVPAASMSTVTNGQEFSYSGWIFLGAGYSQTTGPKLIMTRGNTNSYNGNVMQISNNTNPVIMLDQGTNTMYFAVNTSAVNSALAPASIILTNANGSYKSGYLVTSITYLPLQRWVNFAMVVQNTSLYVYMDGDLYSVATLSDISLPSGNAGPNPIMKGTVGDLLIGDSVNYTPGYISKASFYNYAMSQTDVKNAYISGPNQSSWLSWIGLGNYALRTPIYTP